MASERVRGNDIGPTGMAVAENIARVRKSQQVSLQELERRLDHLGRRISFSGLSKIERGQKRVDVDDLMAISIALDVAPNALLLPIGEPGEKVQVTGALGSLGLFWHWVTADSTPFSRDNRAFIARSLPYWMDEPSPALTWFGRLELSMAKGEEDEVLVNVIEFAKKDRSDVDWDRGRS